MDEKLAEALIERPGNQEWKQGEHQPKSCRDLIPMLLFILHILIIISVASVYSGKAIQDAFNEHSYKGYLYATLLLSLIT